MFTQIKAASSKTSAKDTVSQLLSCHERIRHFMGVAVRLAHAQASEPSEIVNAADGVLRYFTVALPLHEADENLSVHPRLRRATPEGELAGPAADAMVDQHQAIDELLERIIPLWMLTRSNPDKLPEVAAEMCQISGRLNEIFQSHLKLEEETIFPALRKYLTEDDLAAILAEMQDRRRS